MYTRSGYDFSGELEMGTLARAPGKLMLLGEYAVLEGAPALVYAVNRYAGVSLRAAKTNRFTVACPTLHIPEVGFKINSSGIVQFDPEIGDNVPQLRFFKSTVEYLLQSCPRNYRLTPLAITLNTDDFFEENSGEKLGLGSSAALTVALTAGLLSEYGSRSGSQMDRRDILKTALNAHHIAQGKSGSGFDIAASTFGGMIRYQISENHPMGQPSIRSLPVQKDLHILPIWSGRSASTRNLVDNVKRLKSDSPQKYWKIMNGMKELCAEGCEAMAALRVDTFLEITGRYFELLQRLGEESTAEIITGEHRELARMVQDAGAVYKTSGAGGGDFGIALTAHREVAKKVYDNILHSPFNIIKLAPDYKGIEVK